MARSGFIAVNRIAPTKLRSGTDAAARLWSAANSSRNVPGYFRCRQVVCRLAEVENVIPYIGGEEEKSEQEPLRIWGTFDGESIKLFDSLKISAQCLRVAVQEGHTAAVWVKFKEKPDRDEILRRWKAFKALPQEANLPSAPQPFLTYFEDNTRPQPKLDVMAGKGMGVTIGRLRDDILFDYRFVCLSHNTLRGAAGGAVLNAELLVHLGYIE